MDPLPAVVEQMDPDYPDPEAASHGFHDIAEDGVGCGIEQLEPVQRVEPRRILDDVGVVGLDLVEPDGAPLFLALVTVSDRLDSDVSRLSRQAAHGIASLVRRDPVPMVHASCTKRRPVFCALCHTFALRHDFETLPDPAPSPRKAVVRRTPVRFWVSTQPGR